MSNVSPAGRVVLVTGGTKGIGLATALLFARHGAQPILTCRWGSADPADVTKLFEEAGAAPPLILEADVANGAQTDGVMEAIKSEFGRLDVFISNAANAVVVQSIDDLTERGFLRSMRASAWPTVDYLLSARRHFGRYPRHVVAMSSDGPDRFMPGYDFVGAAKAAAESMVRYLAYRLRDEDCRINVLRSRAVKTDAFTETFGQDFHGFLKSLVGESGFVTCEDVANAAFALCSGLFDAMSGQIVMADRGNSFADGISYLFDDRKDRAL